MVFFTCSGCGSSLKKNKVNGHLKFCRRLEYLTCIDCSKDFSAKDYAVHTSCITEDEKYGKTGTQSLNKGNVKQQEWAKKIEKVLSEKRCLSHNTLMLLKKLQNFNNIPRKKGKFVNFMKNAMKTSNTDLVNEIWELLTLPELLVAAENASKSISSTAENNKNSEKMPCETNTIINRSAKKGKKSGKKRKLNEEKENEFKKVKLSNVKDENFCSVAIDNEAHAKQDSVCSAPSSGKFPWKKAIKSCLKSADNNELAMKKLKKKVRNEYRAFEEAKSNGKNLSQGEFNAMFLKKINKNPKFRLHKEKVKLVL